MSPIVMGCLEQLHGHENGAGYPCRARVLMELPGVIQGAGPRIIRWERVRTVEHGLDGNGEMIRYLFTLDEEQYWRDVPDG